MNKTIIIFDTTLRDGEQSPGCSMDLNAKLRVARALEDLGVDVIEAGFPAASPGDFASVRAVAGSVKNAVVCGLARCVRQDIECAFEALSSAERPRLHVFIATSPIHREHKLKLGKAEILDRVAAMVRLAAKLCDDVQFSAEDAARTEWEYLAEVASVAIDSGATTINIPDTVGYAMPGEFSRLFGYLQEHMTGADRAVLSVHCHDDLGLAVANSLAAVEAGAQQIECTINGIGERAGNCSLEEVVMALRTRFDHFGLESGIDSTRLYPASRTLAAVTGVDVQPNKAIVGANAFAHEAGIHQHGMLSHPETYEIMRPEDIGFGQTRLVLGKHSGRHAFRERIFGLGLQVDDGTCERAFAAFKSLADSKKEIDDADIEALVFKADHESGPWSIVSLNASAGTGIVPSASVELSHCNGQRTREAAIGDGPIEATFKALASATGASVDLQSYHVHRRQHWRNCSGTVSVDVRHEGKLIRGQGVSTDIIEASALAFLDVVNRIEMQCELERKA